MSTSNNNSKKADKMPAPLEARHPKSMMLALKTVIVRERERKRQEEEMADKIVERRKQEQEKLRKKREAESLTLEQTKEQITSLENKLVSLRGEKHELFLQLKKVLNESENRRKQIKEQTHAMRPAMNDYTISHPPPHHQYQQIPMHGSHMISVQGTPLHSRPSMLSDKMFKPQTPPGPPVQGIKRTRSPSPPIVDLYPQHPVQQGHFPPGAYPPAGTFRPRGHPPYTSAQASSSAFISQAQSGGNAGYPHRQQPTLHSSFTSGGQTNPSKYQAAAAPPRDYGPILHYPPHEGQGDHYPPGFHGYPPGAGLDSSSKSSSYPDDHYQSKLQTQHLRPMGAVHAAQALPHQILSQQVTHIQQAQNKGMPSSYQSRRKPESPVYGAQKKAVPQPHPSSYPGSQQVRPPSGYSATQAHGQHPANRYY